MIIALNAVQKWEVSRMTVIDCGVSECQYNESSICTADMIQMDYYGCLTFEEEDDEQNDE